MVAQQPDRIRLPFNPVPGAASPEVLAAAEANAAQAGASAGATAGAEAALGALPRVVQAQVGTEIDQRVDDRIAADPGFAAAAQVATQNAAEGLDLLTAETLANVDSDPEIAFGVRDDDQKLAFAVFPDGKTFLKPQNAKLWEQSNAPGVHAADADGRSSELAIGADGRFEPWVRGALNPRFDVRQFLLPGETLPGPTEDASVLIQRAVDQLASQAAADGVARSLFLPPGRWALARKITWRTRVGLVSTGSSECVLIAPNNASAIDGPFLPDGEDYVSCTFEGFTIDGSHQSSDVYTTGIKGIYCRNMRDARFIDVKIRDVWATGFGVDQLNGAIFDGCGAYGCGRGIAELGENPAIRSGHSGFGIGTGKSAAEPVVIANCEAIGNGLYGFFTEKQTQYENYPLGFRLVNSYAADNWVGFKDCGSTGALISNNQFVDNENGIVLAPTVLAPSGGHGGRIENCFISGGKIGVRVTSGDEYVLDGLSVSGTESHGVLIGGSVSRLTVRSSSIHDTGGAAIAVTAGLDAPDISQNRGWNNNGGGLVLSGGHTTTAPMFVYNDLSFVSDHIIDDTSRIITF